MPRYRYARKISRLNFYEDTILFPGETPQDIIGFCIGLTGSVKDKPEDRFLKITSRRVGITQEYTDIRREVGNLLLRLWDHKKQSMDDFWLNNPRKMFTARDERRSKRLEQTSEVPIGGRGFISDEAVQTPISAAAFAEDHDGLLIRRVLEAFNPALHERFNQKPQSRTKGIAPVATKLPMFVNGIKTYEAPLLDIVRPTLLVFTMDTNFVRFVDECIIPKKPSNRLDPYNRNIRLWFKGRAMGWYSHFDTENHKDGGEFWYDLKVQPEIPSQFKQFAKLNNSTFTLADPGDGMGGGERFP